MSGPGVQAAARVLGMGSFRKELSRTVRPRSRDELLIDGVPRRALAGRSWRAVALGWHVPADAPRTPAQRVVEAVEVVPRGRLSGWAAAYVLGADVFDGRDALTGRTQEIRMVLPPSASRVVADGVRCVRVELQEQEVTERHGVRLTTPLRTAIDLAREAPDLVEAVVALDSLLKARVLHPQQLAQLSTVSSLKGAAQARRAGTLARTGVRSPWETRLRLFAQLELRLPEPLVNVPIFDLDGNFLGAPDLLDVEAGLALEFDGAGHRERERHRSDNVREEGFERHGLVVVRADSLDLTQHRPELGRRIVAGRRDGLRNIAPRRWTTVAPSWWRGMPA
jgi:AbiEi antitoxin C-terminal domain